MLTIVSATPTLSLHTRSNQMPISEDTEKVMAVVRPRFPTPELATRWYHEEPLAGFSGLTAAQLVVAGRADDVVEYLAAVDAGIYV